MLRKAGGIWRKDVADSQMPDFKQAFGYPVYRDGKIFQKINTSEHSFMGKNMGQPWPNLFGDSVWVTYQL